MEGCMGLLGSIFGYVRARATHRLMARFLGGPLSTFLMAAYLGKKGYDMYRRRQARLQHR
jgi:hypothetical protein